MKNKIIKLIILSCSLFILVSNINAATSSGSSSNTVKIVYSYSELYGTETPKGYKQPVGCFTNGSQTMMHSIRKYTITSNKTGSSDIAYCIQEDKVAPEATTLYTLNTEVDVRKCKSIGDTTSVDEYGIYGVCGLAQILYEINETDNYPQFKNNDNESYGLATTVMRLWLNYLKNKGKISIGNIENYNYSFSGYGSGFYTGVGLYFEKNASQSLLWSSTDSIYASDWTTFGDNASYCNVSGMSARTIAVEKLFRSLIKNINEPIQDNRFGEIDDYEVDLKNAITEAANFEQAWNVTFDIVGNKTFTEKFNVKCDPEKEDDCYKYIVVQDPTGKNIGYCEGDNIHDGKTCYRIEKFPDVEGISTSSKDSYVYTFKLYNYKPCELIKNVETVGSKGYKPGIKFKIDGGATGFAKLRVYTPNNNNKQIMVTYIDDYKKFDGIEINKDPDEYTEEFDIPLDNITCDAECDPTNGCDDLDQKTDINNSSSKNLSDTCDGNVSNFQEKSIDDPNMACILNSCDENNNYEKTSYLGATSTYGICKGYCREEVKFYVPTPVSVNAGMQFTLDLGESLKRNKAIDNQIDDSKKLTAVVVRYTQCTTVFDGEKYNSTLTTLRTQYDEADYDLKNNITQNKLDAERAKLVTAQATKKTACNASASCTPTEDNNYCSAEKSACSKATSDVSTIESNILNYETLITTYEGWQKNNPGKIKEVQVNKEYCLMVDSDNMKTNINKAISEENYLPSDEVSKTIRDSVDKYGSESAKNNKLTVEYDEGFETNIKSDVKKTLEDLKWCTGGNCYKYNTTNTASSCATNYENFKETDDGIRTGDSITTKNYKRVLHGYTVAKKVYSTMIVRYQSDYYLDSKYKYKDFTGIISDDGENTLPAYTYPVKVDTKTEENYNISYKFNNLFTNNEFGFSTFNYNCTYNVYNTTKKNNCLFATDGKVDISKCSDKCFTMTSDGYSTVDKNCMIWNTDSKKMGLGITFRNVGLAKMFPVTRTNRSNWYKDETVMIPTALINKVDASSGTIKVGDSDTANTLVNITETAGTNIYNSDHLEASYKLTTETIKGIKAYNKTALSNGGYLNDTYMNCVDVNYPTGGKYRKCGSSFLINQMQNTYNAKVGGK